MRRMQPVLWTKGLLLTPQHLQTQDRFFEDLIAFKLATLAYCPWGFKRIEIDREALEGGAVSLSAAEGLFPDGLEFDIPGADSAPPPRPLEGCWDPDQETLDVYLAIPEHQAGGNVSADGDQNARYRAEVLLRRDENTGLAEKPIQVARKNFRLLVEGESLDGFVTLSVCRVNRLPTGEYQLDHHFVPPLIDFAASDFIVSLVRRLVEIMSAKSAELSDLRRQRAKGLADFGVSDIGNFWLLYTVNTYLPHIRHLLQTRHGHPEDLYQVLLSFAGALTTFSPTLRPTDLPTYDHRALSSCFEPLDRQLRELLGTVVPTSHASFPLKPLEDGTFAAAIDDDRLFAGAQWFLGVRSELPVAELLGKTSSLKFGASDRMGHLIKQALPGLVMAHAPSPPSALPVKLGHQYFAVQLAGEEWSAVERARSVTAYSPTELGNPQFELIVLLPPER